MISKWYELKEKAIILRKQGFSIRKIESDLCVPRSTLSGWLKNVQLTSEQKKKLLKNKKDALIGARKRAVAWHNNQKQQRLKEAETRAMETVRNLDINNKDIIELALATLYLGEGTKKKIETSIGSSDPLILKFFIASLKIVYGLDVDKIKCQLNLRADQNPQEMKIFWSKELGVPMKNFRSVFLDKRTMGSKTYPYYKGVCQVLCGNAAIQRKLINISNIFCNKVIKNYLDG